MPSIMTMGGVALLAALLALLLKKDAPTQGFLLSLAAIVLILGMAVGVAQAFWREFSVFAQLLEEQQTLFQPVLRAVGIAMVTRVVGGLCKDAGQSALAVTLDMVGVVAALAVCAPLFAQMLALIHTI